MFEPLLDLVDDLRAGLAHGGDAADDRQLPLGRQAADDVGRLRRRHVGEDQGDGLRMLVDDERQQVLAVDLLQEAERQGLDRLADVVQRGRRPSCPGPARPGSWPPPGRRLRRVRAVGLAPANSWMTCLLLLAADRADLGDLDRDRLDLLRLELAEQLRGLLLGQAHQQDRGFADVGCCHRIVAMNE